MTEKNNVYLIFFFRKLLKEDAKREIILILQYCNENEELLKDDIKTYYSIGLPQICEDIDNGYGYEWEIESEDDPILYWKNSELTNVVRKFAEENFPKTIKDETGELYENTPAEFDMRITNVSEIHCSRVYAIDDNNF